MKMTITNPEGLGMTLTVLIDDNADEEEIKSSINQGIEKARFCDKILRDRSGAWLLRELECSIWNN